MFFPTTIKQAGEALILEEAERLQQAEPALSFPKAVAKLAKTSKDVALVYSMVAAGGPGSTLKDPEGVMWARRACQAGGDDDDPSITKAERSARFPLATRLLNQLG